MLTVLLETFYLGRINELQLVFWDGLVIHSWSRMIWLTSKELLHLGRQHPIYFRFWEKHYPLDKTLDQELRHSGSRLSSILLVPDLTQVSSPRCLLFLLLLFPFLNVAVFIHRVSPLALAASPLLDEHHESHTWTKSINLVHYPQVLAPVQALFGSGVGSFSLASCDQWWINGESIWSKECF